MSQPVINFEEIISRLSRINQKIVFIGGLNLDIQSIPDQSVVPGDSLIGKIFMSPGGVVRNIAENCSLLGLECSLISILGDDAAGESILNETSASGVDMSHCHVMKGYRSCCYSAFLDGHGEMMYAVNDMSLIDHLTPEFLSGIKEILDESNHIVLDSNIPVSTIHYLKENYPEKLLLIDPVSAAKIRKLEGCLDKVKVFKPNIIETEALTGIKLTSPGDFYTALDFFLEMGIERIFISAGSKGIYYADSQYHGCSSSFPVDIKSVTGAGDAASAALILSSILGMDIKEASVLANLTAASSLLTSGTINKKLSLNYLENLFKEFSNEPVIS